MWVNPHLDAADPGESRPFAKKAAAPCFICLGCFQFPLFPPDTPVCGLSARASISVKASGDPQALEGLSWGATRGCLGGFFWRGDSLLLHADGKGSLFSDCSNTLIALTLFKLLYNTL